jgi:integrase
MPWIRTTKSGYRACYRNPEGRTVSHTFALKRDAKNWLATNVTSLAAGTWTDPQKGQILFRRYLEDVWLPTVVDLRESSRARLEIAIRNDLLPVFGKRRIASIGYEDVQAWVTRMANSGRSPATVRKSFYALCRVMETAVLGKYVAVSPCIGVKLPKAIKREMRSLNAEQLDRLADQMPERCKALALVAGWSGLRWSETAGLRVRDVRLRAVEVREGLVEVGPRGDQRGGLVATDLKTDKSHRTVQMPGLVADALAAHITQFCAKRKDGSPDPEGYVFTAAMGGPLRRTAFMRRTFHPAVRRAGLEPLRWHDLRHTSASLAISTGVPILVVSKMLGHSKTSTTLDVYGHLLPDQETALAEKLDEMANAARNAASVRPRPSGEVVSADFGDAANRV